MLEEAKAASGSGQQQRDSNTYQGSGGCVLEGRMRGKTVPGNTGVKVWVTETSEAEG